MNSEIASVLEEVGPGKTGPGEVNFTMRFFFDLLFFIVIGCLLFNMVTGIIVDTFSALREEAEEIDKMQTSESFISGLTQEKLEGTGVTLEQVQNVDQHLWNYIYFALYLKCKDASEYDGIEEFVADRIAMGDLTWFPRRTCVGMELTAARKALQAQRKKKLDGGGHAETQSKMSGPESKTSTVGGAGGQGPDGGGGGSGGGGDKDGAGGSNSVPGASTSSGPNTSGSGGGGGAAAGAGGGGGGSSAGRGGSDWDNDQLQQKLARLELAVGAILNRCVFFLIVLEGLEF